MPLDIAYLPGKRSITRLTVGVYAGHAGTRVIGAADGRLCFLTLAAPANDVDATALAARHFPRATIARDDAAILPLGRDVDDYLADPGNVVLPVGLAGTAFQHRVWRALAAIPAGQAQSYGAIAARIGRPGAARAVGAACAANPVALVVPCHRVIGAGGALTGFSAGLGVATKAALLAAEARNTARAPDANATAAPPSAAEGTAANAAPAPG